MRITNHYLAEMAGWHKVHYYDFIREKHNHNVTTMMDWLKENIYHERWLSWNGDIWFKDPREATMFALVWA
jgi:hypothetical protein